MYQSTSGTRFEYAVIDALRRRHSCDVFTSDTMDIRHRVDGEIRGFGPVALKKPVQIQITRRLGSLKKLKDYLETRWFNNDIISLYVEIEDGVRPYAAAENLAWAARNVQRLKPYGDQPVFGLRINDDAVFFDPYERLRELRAVRSSPERLLVLRPGTAHRFERNGFWIMDDATLELFFAHYIDVVNASLRRTMQSGETNVPILFLADAKGRIQDIRWTR